MVTTFYMLVGLPGTGKSTWTDRFKRKHRDELINEGIKNDTPYNWNLSVISTDDIVQTIADQHRLTYNQLFDNITYSFAEKISHKLAKFAFERNDIVIWDQTNLTIISRAKKLVLVPSHYKKICIVFRIPDDHIDRLQSRVGKIIPEDVMMNMIKSYQQPTLTEGFDDIQSAP
jgi:tRNA uridine 5-carbamoylmethylation protein Kti12